jgi:hypothetical protein
MRQRGPLKAGGEIDIVDRYAPQEGTEGDGEYHDGQNDDADDGEAMAPKAPPSLLRRRYRARLD